jgi:hypothetical protein
MINTDLSFTLTQSFGPYYQRSFDVPYIICEKYYYFAKETDINNLKQKEGMLEGKD